MHITTIRVRRLVSGTGYNHYALEAEARVDDGEEPEDVRERLTNWVDDELRREKALDKMRGDAQSLAYDIKNLERSRDAIRADIARGNKVIEAHESLKQLANEAMLNIPGIVNLGDDLPF